MTSFNRRSCRGVATVQRCRDVALLRRGVAVLWCFELDIASAQSGISASKKATIRQLRGAPQILGKTSRGEIETACSKGTIDRVWRTWTRGAWFEVRGTRFKMWDVASAWAMRALAGWKRECRRDGEFEVSRFRTAQCHFGFEGRSRLGFCEKSRKRRVS